MRLFCLSRVRLGFALVALLALVPVLVPDYAMVAAGVQVLLVVMALIGISRHYRSLDAITQVSAACAAGDMEQRICAMGMEPELQALADAVNRLVDVSDAFIRESQATSDHAAQGKFYRTILPTGLKGAWKRAAQQINDASRQVRQNLLNNAKAAGRRLETGVMQTLTNLGDSTQQLVTTSGDLNHIAAQGSSQAEVLSRSVDETSGNVATIAAAVEEMTASISEISKQVQQTNEMAQMMNREGEVARAVLTRLIEGSEKIGAVAELINTIASQISLLSLNATIEAARAGDAGRGFTVVASEVKGLATRTADATAQVEQLIQKVRDEVGNTAQALEAILNRVSTVNNAACVIAAAIEEQSATTNEISSRLQRTSETTRQFSSSVASMADASGKTRVAAQSMQHSSESLQQASEALRGDIRGFIASLEAGGV